MEEQTNKTNQTASADKEKPRGAKPSSLLHTYKGDVQNLVKKRKLSLMRMAASEADKSGHSAYSTNGQKSVGTQSNKLLVTVLSLVLLGVVALGATYYMSILRNQAAQPIQPQHTSMIFTEKMEVVDATDNTSRALKQELAKMLVNGYYSFGSVVELLITKQVNNVEARSIETVVLPGADILKIFDISLDDRFLDLLVGQSILGIHASKENIPFLVVQTNLYDHVFEKMLKWESDIEQDLAPLFSPNGVYAEPVMFSGDASFKDTVMNNLDVRVLRDADNKTRLMYSFVDKNTLLITTDVNTLIEISERLRISQ